MHARQDVLVDVAQHPDDRQICDGEQRLLIIEHFTPVPPSDLLVHYGAGYG